jgi:predicted PurR-regulated permease PerM
MSTPPDQPAAPPERRSGDEPRVPGLLRTAAAYAWRIIAVGVGRVVLIVIIGQIEGHLLHPIVMSWAVRLHPVVVALAVVGGAVAAGVIGAVVAVPLVAVVWSVYQALRNLADASP